MQVIRSPLALSFTSGCTSMRHYRSTSTQAAFNITTPIRKSIRKCTYAGSDECKLSWLMFRGYVDAEKGGLGSKEDPRSPVNAAFRTVTFMHRSPVILQFDKDTPYEPENEDVFEDEEDEEGQIK